MLPEKPAPIAKGYRTYIVAAGTAILPALVTYLAGMDWQGFLGSLGVEPRWQIPLALVLAGTSQAIMRSITTSSPGKK